MRRTLSLLLALSSAPLLSAEPADKPVGRSLAQRFGPIDQSLAFDPKQGAVGQGRTFAASGAQTRSFQYDQRVAPTKFETREFASPKASWFSKLKFWTKDATPRSKSEIPNATRAVDTSIASVRDAREAGKSAAIRELPDGNRPYLGPESTRLDRSVDPNKPLPGWTGDKLEPLTLEQVRVLLNKNK